jgi:O-antigen/teichoic acid export membrane protein
VIGYIVGRVMFPVYAILQGNIPEFRRTYVQNLQRVALLAFPVSVLLAVAAEPIVIGILGEKWRPVIEPLRILAVYGFVKSITAPAGEVFKGIGRPKVNFVTGILFLAVAAPALVLLVPRFGLDGAAISMLTATVAAGFTKLGWSLKALDLSVGTLFAALAPSALCSAILGIALAILQLPTDTLSPAVALILIVLGGLAAYVAAAAVFARGIVGPVWVSLRGTR